MGRRRAAVSGSLRGHADRAVEADRLAVQERVRGDVRREVGEVDRAVVGWITAHALRDDVVTPSHPAMVEAALAGAR